VILSPEQSAAVYSPATHIAVAATAGSGKSRVLVERIRHLISSGVKPENIACVTFTTGAAKVIEQRLQCPACNGSGYVENGMGGELPEMVLCNCQGQRIRLGHSGTLHSLMLKAIRIEYQHCGYSSPPSIASEEVAKQLLEEAQKETRFTPRSEKEAQKLVALDVPKGTLTKGQAFAAHYHQKLAAAGLIDFDGVLRLGLRVVKAGKLPFKFTHILCDEMQDSSQMDFDIYTYMEDESVFFCGDFDQQIYGFRGACSGFEDLCRKPEATGFTLFRLETCYRCSTEIAAAAESVLTLIPNRPPKRTISHTGPKGKPVIQSFSTFPDELGWMAANLVANAADGSCPLNEAAVLLRTNALANAFREGLKARGIQVRQQRSASRLPGWQKAQAIIAYQVDPLNDFVALEYVKASLGESKAKEIQRKAGLSCCPVSEMLPTSLAVFAGEGDFGKTVQLMVVSGIPVATIEAIEKLHAESADLEELLLAMQRPEEDQSGDGVRVGTIHSVKGQEFNDVYLPAFEDSSFPANRDLSEETRLCYVAITRARNRLNISWCDERPNQFTKRIEQIQPSRFIQLIERSMNEKA